MAGQSVTAICNRALQLCGSAQRITNITDTTREGRIVSPAYDPCRRAELRANPWNFAIKRAQLAADTTAPLFGPSYRFPLPSDCLRVLVPKNPCPDWNVEGRAVVSTDTSPLEIRYVRDETDPTVFDAMFCELLAYRIALAINIDLSDSTAKQQMLAQAYKAALIEARKVDALESVPEQAADSSWITGRYCNSAAIWNQS